jgi:butyryl-CoA dehydrogenase
MFHMMNEARIAVGVSSVMSGLAGYLYSLDYARTRQQGRTVQNKDPLSPQVPIIEHADVKRMLMAQKAAVEGAAALCAFCASLIDQRSVEQNAQQRRKLSLLLEILTPVAKSWPAEHCLEANKLAIQVLGGYGYTREYPVERFYRDNRLNHIHEGTFGIQGMDLLGRKVRLDDGEALTILQSRIFETVATAEAVVELCAEAAALRGAVAALSRATRAVLECPDRAVGLANATLYLDAFGHVVIAWIWLWQALIAQAALERDAVPADTAFYEGKLAACRYFFRYELPLAQARFAQVASLDDTCLRLAAEQFVGS